MPKLGLTMSEGTVLEWKVAPGERFRKGTVLFVVETEKVATEVEAETDGVLEERLAAEGDVVPVGKPVGRLATAGSRQDGPAPAAEASPAPSPPPVKAEAPKPETRRPVPAGKADRRIIATPLARRLARENGIGLDTLSGSGPHGRIKACDVERAVRELDAGGTIAEPQAIKRVKPSATQQAMARRLAEVKHGVPHFYLATEAEVSALLDMRERLNSVADLPRLTLTHFMLAAVGRALVDLPGMNRTWSDGELLVFSAGSVGMAVETDAGLFVPIVPGAGSMSLEQVASSARDLAGRARAGRLSAAEMSGAAISVSNPGMHDVTWLAPIINPGQSAILGVGSVRDVFRPDSEGLPALRREMSLVFSGDHRVHTGVQGLDFLNRVKLYIEEPVRLLRHR